MRFYSAECAMTLTGALMMRASFRSISEPRASDGQVESSGDSGGDENVIHFRLEVICDAEALFA